MAHYFDPANTKSFIRTIGIIFEKHSFNFYTDNSIFSKEHIDFGSRLLIKAFINTEPENLYCLDLGCGLGVVGIISNRICPSLKFDYVDINTRAVNLTKKNLSENNLSGEVLESDCLDAVKDRQYDVVLVNPPIRAGKEVIYKMFNQSYDVLKKGGRLVVVLRQKQGAKTYISKITDIFGNNNILAKDKGFVVCEFTK